jgi:hypothetical protein
MANLLCGAIPTSRGGPMSELDHLVLATPLLSETVQAVARLLGMQPAEGGQHVGRGTQNFLLGLGNGGYLEIIGPEVR